MEQIRDTSKDALSRACIRMGTAMPRETTAARQQLAAVQQKVDAVLPTDTAALAALAEEVEALEDQHEPDQRRGAKPRAVHD